MTLREALKIAECVEIDYSGMTEEEVEELDTAIDKIFEAAKKHLEIDEKIAEGDAGYYIGKKVGRAMEREAIKAFINQREERCDEGPTEEYVAIPYLGETREEKPDREEPKA